MQHTIQRHPFHLVDFSPWPFLISFTSIAVTISFVMYMQCYCSGFYFWIGKITGLNYPENLGIIHFWATFVGVNLTFFPLHFLGLSGMPRRIPDYPIAYAGWNYLSSFGSYVSTFSILIFCFVVYETLTNMDKSPTNLWNFEKNTNRKTTHSVGPIPRKSNRLN